MKQASARARTPELGIASWRQMTVNIVKTKFATDIRHFEVDDVADDDEDAEEIEADIRVMTEQRNNGKRTACTRTSRAATSPASGRGDPPQPASLDAVEGPLGANLRYTLGAGREEEARQGRAGLLELALEMRTKSHSTLQQ
jgi:hypothetical protein